MKPPLPRFVKRMTIIPMNATSSKAVSAMVPAEDILLGGMGGVGVMMVMVVVVVEGSEMTALIGLRLQVVCLV